jgi:hypothetical protein
VIHFHHHLRSLTVIPNRTEASKPTACGRSHGRVAPPPLGRRRPCRVLRRRRGASDVIRVRLRPLRRGPLRRAAARGAAGGGAAPSQCSARGPGRVHSRESPGRARHRRRSHWMRRSARCRHPWASGGPRGARGLFLRDLLPIHQTHPWRCVPFSEPNNPLLN